MGQHVRTALPKCGANGVLMQVARSPHYFKSVQMSAVALVKMVRSLQGGVLLAGAECTFR